MPVLEMTSNFKRVVVAARFDTQKMTHHCNRAVSSIIVMKKVGLFKSGSLRGPWTPFVIESKMMQDSAKMKRFRTTMMRFTPEMTQFRADVI